MENKIETGEEIELNENYLQQFLYRAPKKNHDAIVQNLKQFVPWFRTHGSRVEYYQLGMNETKAAIESAKQSGMDVMDSIANILSIADDEEVWMEVQYFRDPGHCKDVYTKMMQDKSLEPLGTEFFGLITGGAKMITGGFNRLNS